MKSDFATVLIFAVLVLSTLSVAQKSEGPSAQCSLAVVSSLTAGKQKVCDGKLVKEMARRGSVFEQNELGIASMLVIAPGYSQKEALHWFERAALRGYAPAQVNLAVMYANGWATSPNYGAAVYWLREAANQGFARAYYNLGVLYLNGQGVRQDYKEAFTWFEKGAKAGDSSAATNLGYFYDRGLGCDRDATTAVFWYRKAANAGNPLAENNLADMYLNGEGVPKDNREAFTWFQKAAADGSTDARIKLGSMYAQGLGVTKDPQTAYRWVLAASLAGDKRGDRLLASLEKQLNAEQVSAVREEIRKESMIRRTLIAQNAFVQ